MDGFNSMRRPQADDPGAFGANLRGRAGGADDAARSALASVAGPSERFGRSLAVVIGINAYSDGIAPLRSAVADAHAIAAALRGDHAFETWCLLDEDARIAPLLALLHEKLPSALGPDDRLLFYFAGHGIALDSNAGPAGYLIPADAQRADRAGFLPMQVVHAALARLPVRHAFVVLDCCFAGTFRWAHLRDVGRIGDHEAKIYRERYDRYIDSPAWQVLTSASSDQFAFDLLANDRAERAGEHSPFACALLAGLAGAADYTKDNVITADELAVYVRERVASAAEAAGSRQVPQLFALERHDAGQFVFQVPHGPLAFAPAPAINEDPNPYRGLGAFREQDHALFFGREEIVGRLLEAVENGRVTVIVGPSGSGKSSLVQAGLVPALRAKSWKVLPTQRPGREPLAVLDAWTLALGTTPVPGDPVSSWVAALAEHARTRPEQPWLVIVDQFEELLTYRPVEPDRLAFLGALASALHAAPTLHLVVTVRSDTEPRFADTVLAPWWATGRFPIPAMTRGELRQMIERPANIAVLHFQPSRLVERLLDDVALVPAPLPLLSFALSELYRCCWARWLRGDRDRALQEADYDEMGSVAGALTQRATALHDRLIKLTGEYAVTIRNVFVRMVATVGREFARRRVFLDELDFGDSEENARVTLVLQRFHDERLISLGTDPHGQAYAEPVHDELVRGWIPVPHWLEELGAARPVLGELETAVRSWRVAGRPRTHLWGDARVAFLLTLAGEQRFTPNASEAQFVKASARLQRSRRVRTLTIIALVVAALTVAAAISNQQRELANQQRELATASAAEAQAQKTASQHLLARSYQESGRQLVVDGRAREAVPFLFEARKNGEEGVVLQTLFGLAIGEAPPVTSWLAEHSAVSRVAFSKDGRRMITVGDGAQIWNPQTGTPITLPLAHEGPVCAVAWSRDGTHVVTATVSTGGLREQRDGLDGGYLATGGVVRVWDAYSGRLLREQRDGLGDILDVSFALDGGRVMVVSLDVPRFSKLTIYGHESLAEIPKFEGPVIVRTLEGADLHVTTTTQFVPYLPRPFGHLDHVLAAAFSNNASLLATASADGSARIWSLDGKPLSSPLEHERAVTRVAFTGDGDRIITSSDDRTVRVWKTGGGRALSAPLMHSAKVVSAEFNGDKTLIVTTSDDQTVRIWDAATARQITASLRMSTPLHQAVFTPDGERVVIAGNDGVHAWKLPRDRRSLAEWDTQVNSQVYRLVDGALVRLTRREPEAEDPQAVVLEKLEKPINDGLQSINDALQRPLNDLTSKGSSGTLRSSSSPLGHEPLASGWGGVVALVIICTGAYIFRRRIRS